MNIHIDQIEGGYKFWAALWAAEIHAIGVKGSISPDTLRSVARAFERTQETTQETD